MNKLFFSKTDKFDEILIQLKNEIDKTVKKEPSLRHFLLDPFNDHKNRYKNNLKLISKYFKVGKFLDVGASPFHITFCLKQLGYDVIGLDVNPAPFGNFISEHNLIVKKTNIETKKVPFLSNVFDYVILDEVFEHLRINPILALKEINRVLKPGGKLILTTPNLYAIHKYFLFNFGRSINDAYDEFNKLNIYGYIGHIREYSTKEMKKFLEKTNFKVENVVYQNYYSFFKYAGFKNNIVMKLAGLVVDLLMEINPKWRRHQVIISKKVTH